VSEVVFDELLCFIQNKHLKAPDSNVDSLSASTRRLFVMVALWNRADHYIFLL